jgi:two-component system OmpR family response regulator
MKILIVEDDRKVAGFIEQGLKEEGYVVDVAADGEEATMLAHVYDYDIILLDVVLPKKNGFQVATELRREGRNTPILMLTSRDAVEDVVRGLDAGADDYLIKPFSFPELLARLTAVSRRSLHLNSQHLRVGPLSLDLSTRRVTRDNVEIDLTPTEFSLLEFLMRNAGQVLTRKMLSEHLWDSNWEGVTNVIEVHITRLRGKIDRDFNPPLLHTVRGRGYVLRAA